jgi:hypothetical protein
MTLPPLETYVLAKLLAGIEPNGELGRVSEPWRPLVNHVAGLPAEHRVTAVEAAYRMPGFDPDALVRQLAGIDPAGPPPATDAPPEDTATLADLREQMAGAKWDWKGWIASTVLNAIAADPGTGKTLLAVWLARCLWTGDAFPDGQDNPFPAGTVTLWVAGDRHFQQLLDLAAGYGLPDEAMLFNAAKSNATAGLDLDDADELAALERRIRRHRPGAVVVDTVGMTTGKNLCRPEEARAYFGPLMDLAQATETTVWLLTHLSKDAEALGRRIVGACRTVWKITTPDPDGQPNRRRLWVAKSYIEKPLALGMEITDTGLVFDANPPSEPVRARPGPAPEKSLAAQQFLIDKLTQQNDRKGIDLINEWTNALGKPKATIFDARKALVAAGRLVVDDSKKPQLWHLVEDGSETVAIPFPTNPDQF